MILMVVPLSQAALLVLLNLFLDELHQLFLRKKGLEICSSKYPLVMTNIAMV